MAGSDPTASHDVAFDDAPADVAASAAMIAEQRARVEEAVGVDGRLLFGAWGVAWLVGFGVQWALALDEPLLALSTGAGQGIFFGLLVVAGVITGVHAARSSAGVVGTSARQGAMYGWAWAVSFAGVMALGITLGRLGADAETTSTVMTACSVIAVAALYMAGGAIWSDVTQFALGAWIGMVTVAAMIVGYPHLLGVMALMGGGGMLAAAVVEGIRRR